MIELPSVFKRVLKTAVFTVSALALLAACSGDRATNQLNVHYVLAPVDGGSCVLLDASGTTIAGPAKTKAGAATLDVPAVAGMAQLSCAGGTYTDEATGTTAIGIPLRSYIELAPNNETAVVTPLTELALRVLAERDPGANYQKLSMAVASAFGLTGIDINRQVPDDLSAKLLADSDAGRYGAVLAALSQLQQGGSAGNQASAVMDSLTAAMTASGRFKDGDLRDGVTSAMEKLTVNNRLQNQVAGSGMDVLRDVFENMQHQGVATTVWYVDADPSTTQSGVPGGTVPSGVTSSIEIVGRNLHFGLRVTLGGVSCQLHDLRPTQDFEVDSEDEVVTADCPARTAGSAELLVMDEGDVASRTTITVQDVANASAVRAALQARAFLLQAGTGPANVSGTVKAVAPSINVGNGALRYDQLRTFLVKGVVVELLDLDVKDTVLMATSTDANGQYQFTGAPAGKNVAVRVRAQLLKTRDVGSTTGAQWNISVRDNTFKGSPKGMYLLDSVPFTTIAGNTTKDIEATLGFDGYGRQVPADGSNRLSAPFSILEVAYTAVTKLQTTDPNVKLPDLNIYWSKANTTVIRAPIQGKPEETETQKIERGEIATSKFASEGAFPGLFILGMADVDTDEFDQGVIGHEFGHYLQFALSYSDSPGDNHAAEEFKDASLSYGEGYGTAVGGLLTGSPFYTDSSGPLQATGSLTDLRKATAAGIRKGFYSEESIGYMMYKMGNDYGFPAFWKAVSALKTVHHSATVFAFLNQFIKQNPTVSLSDLLSTENIRSTDPLGTLPAGLAPDPAINATVSIGANDLEVLYLTVALDAASGPSASSTLVSTNSPSFCLNHRMSRFTSLKEKPIKAFENTLGLSRRFTFKSTFTGYMRLQPVDDRGKDFKPRYFSVRDETGQEVSILGYENMKDSPSLIAVTQGRVYSLKFVVDPGSVFLGNRCNNNLKLWREAEAS